MAVTKGNSQGPLAIQAGGDGNGRSTRLARGKGNSTPASAVPFPSLRNRLKLLVVDDMSTCQMCQRASENGEHAVEIFAGGANYDLILIDKYLTVNAMTGVEMLAVTASTLELDRREFFAAGHQVNDS